MATSDGITDEDWDTVRGLAVNIVNAPDNEKAEFCRRLLACLDSLEQAYGPLPSILATRADYLDEGDPMREELLHRAYAAAQAHHDGANLLHIAHSLVEMYLESKNAVAADRWLHEMRQHLAAGKDSDLKSEYQRLRAAYRRLVISLAESPRARNDS